MTPLRAIRLAMMSGVLLFGGVSWFLHRTPDWAPSDPGLVEQLTRIAWIAWIIMAGALAVMFVKYRDAENVSRASTMAILAWAQAETLALLGGVVFYLTAKAWWYIAGIIALALTFTAFPPPENR